MALLLVPLLGLPSVVAQLTVPPAAAAFSSAAADTGNTWASAAAFTCDAAVLSRSPLEYYKLDDAGPPTAVNSAGTGGNGTYQGTLLSGVAFGSAGPCAGGSRAVTLDGAKGWVSTPTLVANPQTYSAQIWFRTTTTLGGLLTGFVAAQTGPGGQMDRLTWMDTSGRLVFGTYPGAVRTLTTEGQYNDGQWHQVIATQSSAGKSIFVDGILQAADAETTAEAFSGYWRVGYANFTGNWNSGTSSYFAGSVAGAAFFSTATTAVDAAAQFVAADPPGGCASAVQAANPFEYYHLDEGGGPIALDSSVNRRPGQYQGGVTSNVPGPCSSRNGVTLDGSTGYISTDTTQASPAVYSTSLWFRTTTTRGGWLIGFARPSAGTPVDYDRVTYMNNAGRLVFGSFTGVFNTLTSPNAYNDGTWHHVASSQSAQGMRLSVDGVLVASNIVTGSQNYTGSWRIGGGNFDNWPDQPSSRFFAGSVADGAVFSTALTAAQVTQIFTSAAIATSCSSAVRAAGPSLYYRLNQVTGATAAADSSGNNRPGTFQTPAMFTYGAAGPCQRDGSTGVTLSGATPNVVSPDQVTAPTVCTIAAWVRTTTTSGGRVLGFSSAATGLSGQYDRHLYFRDDGRVVFGVYGTTTGAVELSSIRPYNDGQWHQLVATQSASGTALWLDGYRVATSTVISTDNHTGYWRIGWDNLAGWPGQPTSFTLAGSVADAAIYPTALTPAQITGQFRSRAGP